jgi:hypothetical protein
MTADVTEGSVSVTFYDIHGRKRKVLFFLILLNLTNLFFYGATPKVVF